MDVYVRFLFIPWYVSTKYGRVLIPWYVSTLVLSTYVYVGFLFIPWYVSTKYGRVFIPWYVSTKYGRVRTFLIHSSVR